MKQTLYLACLLLNSFTISAQPNTELFASSTSDDRVDYYVGTVAKPKHKEIPIAYRHHKQLPGDYNGYAIELTTSDLPLPRDYTLFGQFGTVYYERKEEGGYAYLILVPFSKKKSVEEYYNMVVLPKDREAKILEFENGKRQ